MVFAEDRPHWADFAQRMVEGEDLIRYGGGSDFERGGCWVNCLAGFLLKTRFLQWGYTDGPSRKFRSPTKVWSSEESFSETDLRITAILTQLKIPFL